jgi:hypothetical protein
MAKARIRIGVRARAGARCSARAIYGGVDRLYVGKML